MWVFMDGLAALVDLARMCSSRAVGLSKTVQAEFLKVSGWLIFGLGAVVCGRRVGNWVGRRVVG